jgi:hypothetical protein
MSKTESKIKPDEYAADGTRLFNPTKPHGTIYADGFQEGKWVQDNVVYRADRLPVGYSPKHPANAADAGPPPQGAMPVPAKAKKPHWTQRKKLEEAQRAASGAT